MRNKTVDAYLTAIQFLPEGCKTQKMFDKAVCSCSFVFRFVLDQYKTQEICDKGVFKELLC